MLSHTDQLDWTEEELAALPQTPNVFDKPALVFNDHKWIQQGYEVIDDCNPKTPACHPGGIPIPSGKTLVKRGKEYDLIDEL
jgi:hypothetical protein